MKRILAAAAACALGAAFAALAGDAPHDLSASPAIDCNTCHVPHRAAGGTLTTQSGNANLCQSCHVSQTGFGFPWTDADQAVPGAGGHSHRWDAPAVNAAFGAAAPSSTEMAKRIFEGNLSCSACHDQHKGASANGGTQHVSVTPGTRCDSHSSGVDPPLTIFTSIPLASISAFDSAIIAPISAIARTAASSMFFT